MEAMLMPDRWALFFRKLVWSVRTEQSVLQEIFAGAAMITGVARIRSPPMMRRSRRKSLCGLRSVPFVAALAGDSNAHSRRYASCLLGKNNIEGVGCG